MSLKEKITDFLNDTTAVLIEKNEFLFAFELVNHIVLLLADLEMDDSMESWACWEIFVTKSGKK